MVIYAAGNWTVLNNEINLGKFQQKILKKIYGLIRKGDVWEKKENGELEETIESQDIVQQIKSLIRNWLMHIYGMEADKTGIWQNSKVGEPKKEGDQETVIIGSQGDAH